MELTSHHLEMLRGAAMFIGTVDRAGRCDLARVFGATVHADRRTLRILFAEPWAAPISANLRDGGWVAFSFTDVQTYETFQAKGHVISIDEPTEADRECAAQHAALFGDRAIAIGVHPSARDYSFAPKLAVTFTIERLYRQTPGPGAGEPVGDAP